MSKKDLKRWFLPVDHEKRKRKEERQSALEILARGPGERRQEQGTSDRPAEWPLEAPPLQLRGCWESALALREARPGQDCCCSEGPSSLKPCWSQQHSLGMQQEERGY
ncbi:hypothetical protein NN561_011346 [Cricetulus griseus]